LQKPLNLQGFENLEGLIFDGLPLRVALFRAALRSGTAWSGTKPSISLRRALSQRKKTNNN